MGGGGEGGGVPFCGFVFCLGDLFVFGVLGMPPLSDIIVLFYSPAILSLASNFDILGNPIRRTYGSIRHSPGLVPFSKSTYLACGCAGRFHVVIFRILYISPCAKKYRAALPYLVIKTLYAALGAARRMHLWMIGFSIRPPGGILLIRLPPYRACAWVGVIKRLRALFCGTP